MRVQLAQQAQEILGQSDVSDHRGARPLLWADPGELRLSASEQTADGLYQDSVRRPGLQTARLLER
jgi:hypothetical protein